MRFKLESALGLCASRLGGGDEFVDCLGHGAVVALGVFHVAAYLVYPEHGCPDLVEVLAGLIDVKQDQLVDTAPAERDLQDARGNRQALTERGEFGEVGEVLAVLAARVGGFGQAQDGTDLTVWNIAVQKPLKDSPDVFPCLIQSGHANNATACQVQQSKRLYRN